MNLSQNSLSQQNWRSLPRVQQPAWANKEKLKKVEEKLSFLPPLVFSGEILQLKHKLAKVEKGEAFILQGGDCAETFADCRAHIIRENLKVLLQMAAVLTFAGGKPVVKIGRMAGQYAKPRSSMYEEVAGKKLPVYRGDMVNKDITDEAARQPDPERLLKAYYHAAATLNLIRGYTKGGFASLDNAHRWNKEFVKNTDHGKKYEKLAKKIDDNLSFIKALGLTNKILPELTQVDFYTSHEALILEYEQALTRKDTLTGLIFDCSAHFLWIGERTRAFDGAHVDFFTGVANPVGVKVGPDHRVDDILKVVAKINPQNESGKIVLVPRLGRSKAAKLLPPLVKAVLKEGFNLSFCSDPMHGNTFKSGDYKTRKFDDILTEISEVALALADSGSRLGGIHVETTGLNVTECLGGMHNIDSYALAQNYTTSCDPRLNASQSVELAFLLAKYL